MCAVVRETVSLVISRQLLTEVSNKLVTMTDATAKTVSHYILDKVSS